MRLGIVISSRYEFYFPVCFSRLTISLPRGEERAALRQRQNQRKRSVIISDALIERVGISGNRRTRRVAFFVVIPRNALVFKYNL